MKTSQYISPFTPSMMPREDLERIFVFRADTVARITELFHESALTRSMHHLLLIGPRGIGKTHLVSLVYHRMLEFSDLDGKLLIAWMREEEWGVDSFLDLLLRILRALKEEYQDPQLAEKIQELYKLTPGEAERNALILLKDYVADRTLLILLENLDDMFEGLGDEGQKRWRAFLQENPFCAILATAQSLFSGVSRRNSTFYGFFEIQHLPPASLEGAVELVHRIALMRGDEDLARFVKTPTGEARMKAIHHLAGGNFRVYVIFAQLLTCEGLDELVQAVMNTLDELTPYYQSRMTCLSSQQRKIIETLVDHRSPLVVKEIAERCFSTQQTISKQLHRLAEWGYLQSHAIGRESYYELREVLMRLCLEVKKQRGGPIQLFVDFLCIWFSRTELEEKLLKLPPDAEIDRQYLKLALDLTHSECKGKYTEKLQIELEAAMKSHDFSRMLSLTEKLLVIEDSTRNYTSKGLALFGLGLIEEAVSCFDRAIMKDPGFESQYIKGMLLNSIKRHHDAYECLVKATQFNPKEELIWIELGITLDNLKEFNEAVEAFDKALVINNKNAEAWHHRGHALFKSEQRQEALRSFDQAINCDENKAGPWYMRGLILFGNGNFDDGLSAIDRGIRIDPKNSQLWLIKGFMLAILGQFDQSIVNIEKSFSINFETIKHMISHIALSLLSLTDWHTIDIAAFLRWTARATELLQGYPECEIPLRLLNTTLLYVKNNKDPKILMDLTAEQRNLVESIFDPQAERGSFPTALMNTPDNTK